MVGLENVWKIFAGRLENVLKTSWRRLQNVLKKSWKRLEDIWPRRIYWCWPGRLEDVFWRLKAKGNIFILIKTSSEDEDKRRLHQDECFLGSYSIPSHVTLNNSIKANKIKHLRGQISLVHCRGHDFIMLFYFDGFYDNHRQLLSKMFYFR